ncbi:MAG: metal-dependent transcriptional regulator [Erysipelotrichaceae bacterium]|jgi:DtxR family manganese transport transcriptional regulator|nr:metal-dependent transcriptional regulator [Erysipelotrichaceae bacterium]
MQLERREKESVENYLASILDIEKRNGRCYSVDVSHDLNVAKASVSVAMKKLSEQDLVSFGPTHQLVLSEAGHAIAKEVLAKRKLLKEALMAIDVDEETAEADAHEIEHSISKETNKKLYQYLRRQMKK